MSVYFLASLIASGHGPQSEAETGAAFKPHCEDNAQFELISPEGADALTHKIGWKHGKGIVLVNLSRSDFI